MKWSRKIPPDLVRAKRTIGVLFAKLIILMMTPKKGWSGSDDHPDVAVRIKRVLGPGTIRSQIGSGLLALHFWQPLPAITG
jgi:hypothetical protein